MTVLNLEKVSISTDKMNWILWNPHPNEFLISCNQTRSYSTHCNRPASHFCKVLRFPADLMKAKTNCVVYKLFKYNSIFTTHNKYAGVMHFLYFISPLSAKKWSKNKKLNKMNDVLLILFAQQFTKAALFHSTQPVRGFESHICEKRKYFVGIVHLECNTKIKI